MSLAEISKYWWPVRPPSRPVPPDRLARLVSQHWTPDLDVGRNFSISSFCLLLFATNALSSKKKASSIQPSVSILPAQPTARPVPVPKKTLRAGDFESHRIGIADRVASVASSRLIVPAASCVARCAARLLSLVPRPFRRDADRSPSPRRPPQAQTAYRTAGNAKLLGLSTGHHVAVPLWLRPTAGRAVDDAIWLPTPPAPSTAGLHPRPGPARFDQRKSKHLALGVRLQCQ